MANINILCGNIPFIVGSYYWSISNSNYSEAKADDPYAYEICKSSYRLDGKPKSIAVFDCNYNISQMNELTTLYNSSSYLKSQMPYTNSLAGNDIVRNSQNILWDNEVSMINQICKRSTSSMFSRNIFESIFANKNIYKLDLKYKANDSNSVKSIDSENALEQTINNCYISDISNAGNISYNPSALKDIIRHELESSDSTRYIHLINELNDLYGHISTDILEYITDEVPNVPKFSMTFLRSCRDIVKHSTHSLIWSIATAKGLLDHCSYIDSIWLSNLKYLESICSDNQFFNNPYILSAIVYDQLTFPIRSISAYNNINSKFIDSYYHPFRNLYLQPILPILATQELNSSKTLSFGYEKSLVPGTLIDFCEWGDLRQPTSLIQWSIFRGVEPDQKLMRLIESILPCSITSRKLVYPSKLKLPFINKIYSPFVSSISTMHNLKNFGILQNIINLAVKCKEDTKSLSLLQCHFSLEKDEIYNVVNNIMHWSE
ncbi:hypothetical protein cand_000300 [Cryptosporidium andersoni]|uniref:Uncharacterized protein n=1 Tax=Cryptosporidium andersoni TaxID=117008 RepID=A0A1J4MUG4_9CRYT|nr:hypothetical protein cand_000300 [Cryptosporidium andersoni]